MRCLRLRAQINRARLEQGEQGQPLDDSFKSVFGRVRPEICCAAIPHRAQRLLLLGIIMLRNFSCE